MPMLTKKKLIFDFLRTHSILITGIFTAGLLNSIGTLLIPVFIGKYYQVVLHVHSVRGAYFDSWLPGTQDAVAFFILFFSLIAGKGLFMFFQKYLTGYGSELFSRKLREDLLAKQLAFTMDVHNRKPVGKYLLRYSGDLNAIQRYISTGMITFSIDMLFIMLAFCLLFFLQYQMALILLAASILLFGVIMLLNRRLKLLTLKRRNIRSENLSFVASRLHALQTIKVFNREKVESKKFERNSFRLFQYGVQYYNRLAVISSVLPLSLYLVLGILMVYVYFIKMNGHTDIPASTLLIFLMMSINLLPVLKRVIRVNTTWQAGDISFQKVLNIFNAPEESRHGDTVLKNEPCRVTISGVTFGYRADRPVFSNLSFTARPNEITLIKGSQGSGKSTLFKLMLGLYLPQEGTIQLNDIPTSCMSPFHLRKQMTLVSDDLPLLGKTVFESVSYSRKEERRDPAAAMLSKLKFSSAGSAETDLDLPVMEQGLNLSAGQQKLLRISRALLTRKKILLLDEPFSGLDAGSKENFIRLLNSLRSKRTILIADHQETTGLAYDQVVVLP